MGQKKHSGDIQAVGIQGGSHSVGRCGIFKKAGTQQEEQLQK